MEIFIGLVMIYATVHFFIIQKKGYEHRTDYEKVVTWVAIVSIALEFLGTMSK